MRDLQEEEIAMAATERVPSGEKCHSLIRICYTFIGTLPAAVSRILNATYIME